ncbi:hypothetical protein ACA910_018738 [Epithemia clementina (nom. ined.)]
MASEGSSDKPTSRQSYHMVVVLESCSPHLNLPPYSAYSQQKTYLGTKPSAVLRGPHWLHQVHFLFCAFESLKPFPYKSVVNTHLLISRT